MWVVWLCVGFVDVSLYVGWFLCCVCCGVGDDSYVRLSGVVGRGGWWFVFCPVR